MPKSSTSFVAGNQASKGVGRPKGVPNRTTTVLKDAILLAAACAGKSLTQSAEGDGLVQYLSWLAINEPPTFGSLLGKVIPLQIAPPEEGAGALVITWLPPEGL